MAYTTGSRGYGNAIGDGTSADFKIDGLIADAEILKGYVQDYIYLTEQGIQKFDPTPTVKPTNPIYPRSYAGYTLSIPDEVPSINIDDPDDPDNINAVTFVDVSDPGDYDGYTYSPIFKPIPNWEDITDPGDWDDSIDVYVPTDVTLSDLVDPIIKDITVPNIPQVEFNDFTGIAPNFDNIHQISESFDFTEIDYTSDVLTQVDSLVQQMIAGGVGIPESIWNRIFERAGVQVDQQADQLVRQTNTEWASRGFSLPQGVQASQVQQARQEAFNKKAELARDNAIAYSQEEIKNLQFAVQQGIAFETLRGGWHEQEMQRTLESAKFVVEADIKLLEADIALINAKVSVYNSEAQVYKTLVEAEISKLEKYRLDIAAQELNIKANDNQIRLYGARIQALQLVIEEFNAEVKAAGVETQLMQTKVNVFSEKTKTFSALIQEQVSKFDTYKIAADTEGVKMSAYEIAVKAYSAEVQAYSSRIGGSKTKVDAEVAVEQLKIDTYDSYIKGYASNVGAKVDAFKADVAMFDSYIKAEGIQGDDFYKQTQSELDSDKNIVAYDSQYMKLLLADAENATRAAEASAKIHIDTTTSLAELNAGLAGSIYSAVNIGSSTSVSAGTTSGNSFTTTYDGGVV